MTDRMKKADRVHPDDPARSTPARRSTLSWSAAVDHRLDQLVARASGAGAERSDLLAALVAAAPDDGEALDRLVLNWRRRTVREVVLDIPPEATGVRLPRHPPGRRARS